MKSSGLLFTFTPQKDFGRGSVFIFKPETYIRARVDNLTSKQLGIVRGFLTKIERVENGGKTTVVSHDTFKLNWASTSGADIEFHPQYGHHMDLLAFNNKEKAWKPMTTRGSAVWKKELTKPGTYRMHILLAGAQIPSQKAVLEFQWPIKKIEGSSFSFDLKG